MPESKSRILETGRFASTIESTRVEMEEVGMDFIVGLPRTRDGYDSIWVIVGRLTKVAHFIPIKTTYTGAKLAELYMSRIVCLHGVPKKIVSDRGTQFTSRFWEKLHESMDTKLNFSSAYHPQTDGQTERTNQILEDMLRACALKHGGSWDKSCHTQSLPTITTTKPALRWLLLKPYRGESAEHHYTGVRQGRVNFLY
jgi:transposase InsO family protein